MIIIYIVVKAKVIPLKKLLMKNEPVNMFFLKSEFMEENIAPKGIIPAVLDDLLKARMIQKRVEKEQMNLKKKY